MRNYFRPMVILTIVLFASISLYFCGNSNNTDKGIPLAEKINKDVDALSKREMQSVFQFMGDDLFEGRAPGTRGGELAEKYLRSVMKLMNIEPYGESYMQPFIINGFTTSDLKVTFAGVPLDFNGDVLGTYTGDNKEFSFNGETVFIGFGTKTDLWDWDDFKDYDITDKIVVSRVNDPGMFIEDIFEGKILTYFGRWRYHIEEARRRGAKAIFLIHTDASAGYGWNTVQNSWSGEELYLKSEIDKKMLFTSWIREEVLRKILDSKGYVLDELYAASLRKDFRPVPLGFDIQVEGISEYREINNNNVIGFIKGKSDKSIVLSAHIDHLGMLMDKQGDNIQNGAIDNGTAVAAMMMTAKVLKKYQKDLYYSVIVLGPNAEEGGLLGSRYYVSSCDKGNIIANINFESTPVWGKSGSIMGIGARFSTMEDMLKEIAKKEGLEYKYFSMSNQGFFYRSDQYPFANANIPSLWISAGEDDDSGTSLYKKFWKEVYHTVEDEYDPSWSLEGLRQTIRFALLLIDKIDSGKTPPVWKRKTDFSGIFRLKIMEKAEILKKASELPEMGIAFILITVTETKGSSPSVAGGRMILTSEGDIYGNIGGGTLEKKALTEAGNLFGSGGTLIKKYLLDEDRASSEIENTGMVCGGEVTLFFEHIGPDERVAIFGAGHIGKVLFRFLSELNFSVSVLDDREKVDTIQNNLRINYYRGMEEALAICGNIDDLYIVIASHSHEHDYKILKSIILDKGEPAYTGVVASRKKIQKMISNLKEELGEKFDNSSIYSPAGLDIGGNSPSEIALSIAAEIQSVRYNKKNFKHLSKVPGTDK